MKTDERPGKPASLRSLIRTCFVIMCGIAFTVLVANTLHDSKVSPAMTVFFYLVMAVWITASLVKLVLQLINLKGSKGLPVPGTDPGPRQDDKRNHPINRLLNLEARKRGGQISEEEFTCKREEIMKEKW